MTLRIGNCQPSFELPDLTEVNDGVILQKTGVEAWTGGVDPQVTQSKVYAESHAEASARPETLPQE